MATTKAPTGLTISRNNNVFTFKWKRGDANYSDGQQLQYKYSNQSTWNTLSVSASSTSRTVTLPAGNYYPYKNRYLHSVSFRVRGKREEDKKGKKKYAWSAWSVKTYNVSLPPTPTLTAALSGELTNQTTFSWSAKSSATTTEIFKQTKWQTVRLFESNQTDGSKLNWSASNVYFGEGTGTANGSRTYPEDSEDVAKGSLTRWFRVRSEGPKGVSPWKYAKHVYAVPYKAKVLSARARENEVGGFSCNVTWIADQNAAHPIDRTTVQYAIVTPAENMECPSGASWTDADVSKDTLGNDGAFFPIDDIPSVDECLYVRVNTTHDSNTTYGTPTFAAAGFLSNPSNISVDTYDATHRATIEATNNSSVPDSFLAVYYRTAENPDETFVVGIIPKGETSVTVQCPDWADSGKISFGVQAMVGAYRKETRADGVDSYSIDAQMQSKSVFWEGGTVPLAPDAVTATPTSIAGTVRMTWNWSWQEADSAELSWADHEDAWESTSEPSSYTISNLHAAQWNISGLQTGKRWYFRVRLIAGTENPTKGPWSDIVSLDLSSAPNIPSLELSDSVITEEGEVTASWVYTTTDGTPQSYAEISKELITENGVRRGEYVLSEDDAQVQGKEYYELSGGRYIPVTTTGNPKEEGWYEVVTAIAHTETAQHVTLNAQEKGWKAGETYRLCVRVVSSSGQSSGWSDYTSVTVAEPLNCEITTTSLVEEEVQDDGTVLAYTENSSTGSLTWDIDVESLLYEMEEEVGNDYTITKIEGVDDWHLSISSSSGASVETESQGGYGIDVTGVGAGSINISVNEKPATRLVQTLKEMPLSLTVIGAGEGGTTTVAIERAETYHVDRPDGGVFDGYEGETVALKTQTGEEQIVISLQDVFGALDDGAKYRIMATVQDGLGQSAQATLDFEVSWAHQAIVPTATAEVENYAVKITPMAEAQEGDVVDIYRLSADKPELIVEDGTWGDTYVDPYPAIGEYGGHRIVYRTANGDYITEDLQPAWVDLSEDEGDIIDSEYNLIDFGGERIELFYNVDYTNDWEKDFRETVYLGGSVQGDWNVAVTRSGSMSTLALTITDQEMIASMRRLATYTGVCHVRTRDGSSFAADIQVSEDRNHEDREMIASFSMKITRIDPEGYEGLTLSQWEGE